MAAASGDFTIVRLKDLETDELKGDGNLFGRRSYSLRTLRP